MPNQSAIPEDIYSGTVTCTDAVEADYQATACAIRSKGRRRQVTRETEAVAETGVRAAADQQVVSGRETCDLRAAVSAVNYERASFVGRAVSQVQDAITGNGGVAVERLSRLDAEEVGAKLPRSLINWHDRRIWIKRMRGSLLVRDTLKSEV